MDGHDEKSLKQVYAQERLTTMPISWNRAELSRSGELNTFNSRKVL